MNLKKILVLLIIFVVYINYENYIRTDVQKLYREKFNLETNIEREKKISDKGYNEESLLVDYSSTMYSGKNNNYSRAMGEFQNQITKSTKQNCNIKNIQWAQVPNSKIWYEVLKMNLSIVCKPNNFFKFMNNLRSNNKIYVIENIRISKNEKKASLNINMQLSAFRVKNEVK